MYYACQENAWMDERVMFMWVEKVLKPSVKSAPEGIVPLLLLDSYHCHVMASVVNEIQDLGVEVEHIPGACTYLCQPANIGINKPYKKHMRHVGNLDGISMRMIGHPTCNTPLESSFHVLFVCVNNFFLVLVYRNLVTNVFCTGGVVT